MWLEKAQDMKSKGQLAPKAKRLADLHERRSITQGQFFTPAWISAGMWQSLAGLFLGGSNRLSVVDTSIGTGRLINPAPIDRCSFYGFDIDDECIQALSDAANELDAVYDFRVGDLGTAKLSSFDIAIINPPFGLTIQNPNLEPYECTSFGIYGPNTSTKSHEYALAQALDCARFVAALLPATMIDACKASARLHTIAHLPAKAFISEGANVKTIVAFFDRRDLKGSVTEIQINEGDEWPVLSLSSFSERDTAARMRFVGVDHATDVITRPVTGDNTVTLHHHRRNLVLKFNCAFTEAKVMNGLLEGDVKAIERHRYPEGMTYVGSGKFFLDSYLVQDDPHAAFASLLGQIRDHGG